MVTPILLLLNWTALKAKCRRVPQNKKHKTWDGDGVLVVDRGANGTMYDMDGKMHVIIFLFEPRP